MGEADGRLTLRRSFLMCCSLIFQAWLAVIIYPTVGVRVARTPRGSALGVITQRTKASLKVWSEFAIATGNAMFSNRNSDRKSFMSSFRRKSSGGTSSADESPGRKSSMKKQGTYVANGMPAPSNSVVQEVEQKRAEDNSAVKVQAIIRGKSARTEADGKKKQKKEENEAAPSLQPSPPPQP